MKPTFFFLFLYHNYSNLDDKIVFEFFSSSHFSLHLSEVRLHSIFPRLPSAATSSEGLCETFNEGFHDGWWDWIDMDSEDRRSDVEWRRRKKSVWKSSIYFSNSNICCNVVVVVRLGNMNLLGWRFRFVPLVGESNYVCKFILVIIRSLFYPPNYTWSSSVVGFFRWN